MKVMAIISGVLTLVLGIYAMCNPAIAAASIGWYLGFVFLVNGTQGLMLAGKNATSKTYDIVFGIISLLAGFSLLFNQLARIFTDFIIVAMVAIVVVIYGVTLIVKAFAQKKAGASWGVTLIGGILSTIIGIVSLGHPLVTALSLGLFIGMSLTMQGIVIIMLGSKSEIEKK